MLPRDPELSFYSVETQVELKVFISRNPSIQYPFLLHPMGVELELIPDDVWQRPAKGQSYTYLYFTFKAVNLTEI